MSSNLMEVLESKDSSSVSPASSCKPQEMVRKQRKVKLKKKSRPRKSHFGQHRKRAKNPTVSTNSSTSSTVRKRKNMCKICSHTLKSQSCQNYHQRIKMGYKPYFCPVCKRYMWSPTRFHKHILEFHPADPTFRSDPVLSWYLQKLESLQPLPDPPVTTIRIQLYTVVPVRNSQNQESLHKNEPNPSPLLTPTVYCCELCGDRFSNPIAFNKHVGDRKCRKVVENRTSGELKCIICNTYFSNEINRNRHVRTIHRINPITKFNNLPTKPTEEVAGETDDPLLSTPEMEVVEVIDSKPFVFNVQEVHFSNSIPLTEQSSNDHQKLEPVSLHQQENSQSAKSSRLRKPCTKKLATTEIVNVVDSEISKQNRLKEDYKNNAIPSSSLKPKRVSSRIANYSASPAVGANGLVDCPQPTPNLPQLELEPINLEVLESKNSSSLSTSRCKLQERVQQRQKIKLKNKLIRKRTHLSRVKRHGAYIKKAAHHTASTDMSTNVRKPKKMCKICSLAVNSKPCQNYHYRIELGHKPFFCPVCKRYLWKRTLFNQHMIKLHSDDPSVRSDPIFSWYLQKQKSSQPRSPVVATHPNQQSSHGNEPKLSSLLSSGIYCCVLCGNTFTDPITFDDHVGNRICQTFNFIYFPNEKDRNQDETIHGIQTIPKRIKIFSCSQCGKTFHANYLKLQHEKVHTNKGACPYCPQVFKNLPRLRYHKLREHPAQEKQEHHTVACDICNMTFKDREHWNRHFQTLHNDRILEELHCKNLPTKTSEEVTDDNEIDDPLFLSPEKQIVEQDHNKLEPVNPHQQEYSQPTKPHILRNSHTKQLATIRMVNVVHRETPKTNRRKQSFNDLDSPYSPPKSELLSIQVATNPGHSFVTTAVGSNGIVDYSEFKDDADDFMIPRIENAYSCTPSLQVKTEEDWISSSAKSVSNECPEAAGFNSDEYTFPVVIPAAIVKLEPL